MRRGVALLVFSLWALGWLSPCVFAQYPYSYAPPVYNPAPMPYGYYPPGPMPYGYNPQAQMPYGMPSAPMPMYPPTSGPRVFVYGPLEDPQPAPKQPAPKQPAPKQPVPKQAAPAKLPDAVKNARPAAKSDVMQVQATLPPAKDPAPVTRSSFLPALPCFGACGAEGCGDGACDSGCPTCIPRDWPQFGHGQLIAVVGANILVPYASPRQAFATTTNGLTSNNDFPRDVDAGPFVSLGYLAHNGWGIRADYWYLNGSQNQSAGNNNLGTVVGNPLGAGFQFTSPSPTFAAGIGSDQYAFSQSLTINVADLEGIREVQFMDTTFLFGAGARYARIVQTYTGVQSNPGGANGIITVAQDVETASGSNTFEGWGPTVSLEVIHAIPRSCFSIYGNARGSFVWGNDTFTQSLRNQNNTIAAAGVAAPIDVTTINTNVTHREASIGEAEVGLQYGGRCGPCYVFVRAGASFQRWWDVGSPSTQTGSLSFIGGVARVGVSY